MQPQVDRRSALIPSALAAVGLAWLVARAVWSGTAVPAWLFWPLLAVEAFALVRLVLWTVRLLPGEPDADGMTPVDGAPLSVDVAVLVPENHDREGLLLTMLSASRVKDARGVVLVGPAGDHLDQIATRSGARRVVASGD
ncbi:MAG: hypothetical protein M3Y51_05620, partial [Actinomycetota bacterium]|nr:hypothetical protein [Actinomycetota bacterium]